MCSKNQARARRTDCVTMVGDVAVAAVVLLPRPSHQLSRVRQRTAKRRAHARPADGQPDVHAPRAAAGRPGSPRDHRRHARARRVRAAIRDDPVLDAAVRPRRRRAARSSPAAAGGDRWDVARCERRARSSGRAAGSRARARPRDAGARECAARGGGGVRPARAVAAAQPAHDALRICRHAPDSAYALHRRPVDRLRARTRQRRSLCSTA